MIKKSSEVIRLYTNLPSISSELIDVLKLFVRSGSFEAVNDTSMAEIVHNFYQKDNHCVNVIAFNGTNYQNEFDLPSLCDDIEYKRLLKRYAKLCMYDICVKVLAVHMPWGALTGIRPTKLAWELLQNGEDFKSVFSNLFDVSAKKIALVDQILDLQKKHRDTSDKDVDIYVGIPFCASRCSYCSFTGGEISKMQGFVVPYVNALSKEIKATLQLAKQGNYKIKNVYFGGGTPTALPLSDLENLIALFDDIEVKEFTVEAGRPDTINKDTFKVFKSHGVDRVSINPQTFSQRVLDLVGRKHTIEEVFERYEWAKACDLIVNMDFIAGLPTQSFEDFSNDVSTVLKLSPDNVTIHTLALKKGTLVKESTTSVLADGGVEKMVDFSYSKLTKFGYLPYYMYRQKYMADNLENIGYCKTGKECVYNIDMMEETTNILACGSNSISKRIFAKENRLERVAAQKDLPTYINAVDEIIEKKKELFL